MPIVSSPLRYPGGKTQLTGFVSNLIELNNIENPIYIEPFSGGAGVAIELLLNNKVDKIVLNDYDKSIYAVWYSILNQTEALIDLIESTPINIENWFKQKRIFEEKKNYQTSLENGFATLFLNRTNRSGIINAGPIGGYEQSGKYKLDCRFNKTKIIEKIRIIASQKHRIDLYRKDTVKLIDIIRERYSNTSSFIFFDPPYYVQGNKLYTNFYTDKDHRHLFNKINSLDDYFWITTYDYSPQIHAIYEQSGDIGKYYYNLRYSAQTKRRALEFMFSSSKTKILSYDKVILTSV
ncbi:DNA adenine methylase [Listeria booriae]|uniref:DNA adenine methylase n=1 Tax=Listeria booriae TaxID=1552123 RepID=UPI0016270CF8|nr:DNA adenine methylase [Listeria booriae]MBC2025046.1 DNA adenine methylase [Listeria booriae]MBC2067063.1 DNA adenine methylase [Listeria booriae]MBC2365201.1 DNA adenine methylase [Listeria booriae]